MAVRRLRATPGFTAISVASLALATGLNILIFSFTSPVLFKALPYPEPDRLLDVSMAPPGKPEVEGRRHAGAVPPSARQDAVRPSKLSAPSTRGGRPTSRAMPAGPRNGWTATGFRRPVSRHSARNHRLGRLPVAADEEASAAPTTVLSYRGVAATLWWPIGHRRPDGADRWTSQPRSLASCQRASVSSTLLPTPGSRSASNRPPDRSSSTTFAPLAV